MKTIKYLTLLLATVAIGCNKQETILYEGENRISFFLGENEVDSLNYTFAFDQVPKQRDTVYLQMRIQGATQSRPRAFKVVPGQGTTALLDEDFILPDIQLPSDAITVNYPVILLNTKKMETQSYRIVLEVSPSDDFLPGGTGQEIGGTRAVNAYKIWVSNKPERPAYWSEVESYFGKFSAIRMRFMISTLGISNFSRAAIGAYGLLNYPVALRNALVRYELEHGSPLTDEFGVVTF